MQKRTEGPRWLGRMPEGASVKRKGDELQARWIVGIQQALMLITTRKKRPTEADLPPSLTVDICNDTQEERMRGKRVVCGI